MAGIFTTDRESDNYSTNKAGWEIIKDFIPKEKIIWSPFYSDGKQKEYFTELGFNILHEDKDFFQFTPEYDLIVDNPPFSKIKEISLRLKDLDKPFIIICVSSLLLAKWFQVLFKKYLQVIIPEKRTTFTHLTNGKTKYTPPFGTMYFCYKMKFERDLIWL